MWLELENVVRRFGARSAVTAQAFRASGFEALVLGGAGALAVRRSRRRVEAPDG